MSNIQTTNLPGGLSTAPIGSTLTAYAAPDPTVFHTYFNDFDVFTAGDWTGTATGSVTNSIIAGDGGWLGLANSASNNDLDSLQLKTAGFLITAGQLAWFKTRFKVSNATNSNVVVGLIPIDTTPIANTAGISFSKLATSTTLNCLIANASAATTVSVGTMADDTFVTVGWHYTGSAVNVFLNGSEVNGTTVLTNLPTVALALTIAVSNGTAAANTLTVDYVMATTERPSTLG